jgi:hypothetical protein
VDLQERLQIDVAREQVARVRARARPWRAILALVLALVAAAFSEYARHVADMGPLARSAELLGALGRPGNLALAWGAAAAFLLLGVAATIGLGNQARAVLQPSIGSSHAAVVRFAVLVVAGLATIVITMELFAIPVTQLIVGGALTGVLVGIAAQQSLANVFAGIVLLVARPFRVGDMVGIRSGALSGLIEGTVAEVSVTYVRLDTPNGPVHVPNSQVLAAAVGPAGAVLPPGGQASPASQPAPGPAAPGAQAAVVAEVAAAGGASAAQAARAGGPAPPASAQPSTAGGQEPASHTKPQAAQDTPIGAGGSGAPPDPPSAAISDGSPRNP